MDRIQACVSIVATVALASTTFAAERLTVNEPALIGGIETVCGGVTLNDRKDTKWRAYSVRLEFVGKGGQYLGDERVTVKGNDHEISVDCLGPWVLMKLPAGSYDVAADVADAGQKAAKVRVPARGQVVSYFRFPNAGGEITRTPLVASAVPMPTRISVTPRASLRAELLPQSVQAQVPSGRRYGLKNLDSRITLRAHRPTIVAIRDSRNRIFIDRKLATGDTYRVPDRMGLWLTAIDAGAVEIELDAASVGFAGAQGATVRDLSLNPESIVNRSRTG